MKRFGVKSGVICILLASFLLFPALAQARKMTKTGAQIMVTSPRPHQCVTSPLSVEGRAKGDWISDGSISMTLIDDQGNQIASGTAQTQGDWQSKQQKNQFVFFTGKLDFSVNKTTKAKLVLVSSGQTGAGTQTGSVGQGQTEGGMTQESQGQGQPQGQTQTQGQTQAGQMKKEIPVVLSSRKKR
jgi:hypothetical protein